MKIDWHKIDDFKKLQRLINDLVCLDTNRMGFMHSSPEIGKDKGLDGWYEGIYPKLEIVDISKLSIQSKWVKDRKPESTFNKMSAYLKGNAKEKGEIQKAIDNGADYLLMGTNGELSIEQKTKLSELAKGTKLKRVIIWDSEDLRSNIELYPYLKFCYFGDPQYPSIVPSVRYFSEVEPHLLNLESFTNFKDFTEENKKIDDFIRSENLITVIHAPGGFGKSHFLKYITTSNSINLGAWNFWSYKLNHRPVDKIIDEETSASDNYILVIDDADRDLTAILPLLKLLTSGQTNLKIILTARTASLLTIREAVASNRLTAKAIEVDLTLWSEEELVKLFNDVSGETNEAKIQLIVRNYPNPYLLVEIGKNFKGEKKDMKDVLMRMYDNLLLEVKAALSDLIPDIDTRTNLLANIALILPFSISNDEIITKIADTCNLTPEIVKKSLDILLELKILRLISSKYRFNPDLKGDIFLAKYLENSSENDIKEKFLYWVNVDPVQVFNNLNSALNHTDSKGIAKLVESYIDELIAVVRTGQFTNIDYLLNICKLLSTIAPKKVYDLFKIILKQSSDLSTDETGPVFLELNDSSLTFEHSSELLISIIKSNKEGTYDNYKPKRLAEDMVNPLYNSVNRINEVLDGIGVWVNNTSELGIEKQNIIGWILKELLAISYDHSENWGMTINFGSRALNNTQPIIDYRKRCLAFLKQFYSINFLLSLEIINSIGHRSMVGGGFSGELPLEKVSKAEQEEMMQFIKDNLPNIDLLAKINFETFLLHWWAQERSGEKIAEDVLRNFERDTDYLIVRTMIEQYEASFQDFDVFKNTDLSEKAEARMSNHTSDDRRWSWYVWSKTDNEDHRREMLKLLVPKLKEEYNDSEKKIAYLNKLNNFVQEPKVFSNNQFIEEWVKVEFDNFLKLYTENHLQIPEIFRSSILFSLFNLLENSVEMIDRVFTNLQEYNSSEIEVAVIKASFILEKEDFSKSLVNVIHKIERKKLSSLIFSIGRIDEKLEKKQLGLIIDEILTRIDLASHYEMDNLSMLVGKNTPESLNLGSKSKKKLKHLLTAYPALNYHTDNLIKFAVSNIQEVMNFIKSRLHRRELLWELRSSYKPKGIRVIINKIKTLYLKFIFRKPRGLYKEYARQFDSIDIDGFTELDGYITNFSDFKKFFDILLKWDLKGDFYSGDIDRLAAQVIMKDDDFHKQYAENLYSNNRIKELLYFVEYLPIEPAFEILMKYLDKLISLDTEQLNTVKKILLSKTHPREGWSGTPGEAPPLFVNLRNTYQELINRTEDERIKGILQDCIKEIDAQINQFINRDEEFLVLR